MATTRPNWTLVQVNGSERPIYGDKRAGAPIKPGHICVLAANNVINPVTTADALTARIIAVEASWANTDTTKTSQEQPYATGDTVNYIYAQSGDLVQLHLAASQTAVVGASLRAAAGAAGEVSVETTNKDATVQAVAEEAVTTGAGETKRILARII